LLCGQFLADFRGKKKTELLFNILTIEHYDRKPWKSDFAVGSFRNPG